MIQLSSEKQKPKLNPRPKLQPDRLTKAMKNPVSTYKQFQALEGVESEDSDNEKDMYVSDAT